MIVYPLNIWAAANIFFLLKDSLVEDVSFLRSAGSFFLLLVIFTLRNSCIDKIVSEALIGLWNVFFIVASVGYGISIYFFEAGGFQSYSLAGGLIVFFMCFQGYVSDPQINANHKNPKNANAKKYNQGDLAVFFSHNYLVQPCVRCFESEMCFLKLSKEGNSIQYQCVGCKKKSYAPVLSNSAKNRSLKMLKSISNSNGWHPKIVFTVQSATLPYQQTAREHLTDSVRSEVWRRDMGKCTTCGTRENLEFDHIIPVSKGGANSVRNLQLLCRSCNASKSNKI